MTDNRTRCFDCFYATYEGFCRYYLKYTLIDMVSCPHFIEFTVPGQHVGDVWDVSADERTRIAGGGGTMTDNRTTELRISEPLRGFIRHQSNRAYIDGGQSRWLTEIADKIDAKHEQAIAATLGSERDATYNAGFDNGVKATLQQLEGIMNDKWSSSLTKVENIEEWIAEQWKEHEL